MIRSSLLLTALAFVSWIGCTTPNTRLTYNAIESYRKLDLPPPASEAVPLVYKDTLYGFEYARPEMAVERFHTEWKMTLATHATRGVFVLRANSEDTTLTEVALYTNILYPSDDPSSMLAKFQDRFTASSGVESFERITIDGRPAAIAQYRMINPIDTFMMYQCRIPDSVHSYDVFAIAPAREFGEYKEAFRKAILSTKIASIPVERRRRNGGC